MSIKAMKLALEALTFDGFTPQDVTHREMTAKAVEALRTAIQQAEAKTGEPVAWVVMNGLSKYQVCGAKAPADALCSEMQKRHDLSGSLAAFHVQPLYTHPAPGVPDDVVRDADRLDWLARNPVDALDVFGKSRPDEARFIRATIDAAMTAAQAQKGQP